MNALTSHDTYIQSPYADDQAYNAEATDNALDEMVREPDSFDAWLSDRPCPSSVAGLLSLILDRGLPTNNKTDRDDELSDLLDARMTAVRDDFDAWAKQPERFKPAPVDVWMADAQKEREFRG